MRKTTSLVLAGAMAFGLTAAAAQVTAFTIDTVEEVPGTDSATATIATGVCTGTYAVDFTQDEFGYTDGGTATRTAPDPDPNLSFCADAVAYVELRSADASELTSWSGSTDESGNITFSFENTYVADDGWEVEIEIGPDAGL